MLPEVISEAFGGTSALVSIIIGAIVLIAFWLRHSSQHDATQAVQSSNTSEFLDPAHLKLAVKRGGAPKKGQQELSTPKPASSRVTGPIPASASESSAPPEAAVSPPCITVDRESSASAVAVPLAALSPPSSAQPSSLNPSTSSAETDTSAADEKQKFLLILDDLFHRTDSADFKSDFEGALSGSGPGDWERMNSMRSSAELAAFQVQGFKDSDSCNKLRKKYAKQKADDMAKALQRTEWLYARVNDWAKAHKAAVASSSSSSTPSAPKSAPPLASSDASSPVTAAPQALPSVQSVQADANPSAVASPHLTSQFRVTVTKDAEVTQTGSLLCPVLVVKGQLHKLALIRNSDGARAVVKSMVDANKQKIDVAHEGMQVCLSLGKVVDSKDQKGDGCVALEAGMLKCNTELRSVKSLPEQGHCLWYKVTHKCVAGARACFSHMHTGAAAAFARPRGRSSRCRKNDAPSAC